eukprot:3067955-Pleurochrysis_carterae.AAC.1
MSCACLIRMSAFGPAVPCSRAISPETASGAGSGCGGSGSGSGTCSRSPSRSTRKPSCLRGSSAEADGRNAHSRRRQRVKRARVR